MTYHLSMSRVAGPKPIIAVDIDGVLADTQRGLEYWAQQEGRPTPPVPYTYEYWDVDEDTRAWVLGKFKEPDFYAHSFPIKGAFPALHELARFYRPVFITARAYSASENQHLPLLKEITRNWLMRLFEQEHITTIFCRHEKKAQALLSCWHEKDIAFAIEDNPATCRAYHQAGIKTYMVDYPYNSLAEEHSLVQRVSGLWEIVYLEDAGHFRVRADAGDVRGPFDSFAKEKAKMPWER